MKLLIISAGVHPVPPVNGGAVENLMDFYLKDNDKNEINVLSIWDERLRDFNYNYKKCSFHFIKKNKIYDFLVLYCEKILRKIFGIYFGTPYIRKVCSFIKKRNDKYDLIIIENMPQYGPKIKKISEDKLVLHLHNDYLNKDSFKSQKNYDSFDKIICVSDFISNRVREIAGKAENKVFTLYNGIDLNKFSKTVESSEIYDKYNIKKTKFNIIYSGRICPEKGVENLIDSFIKINNSNMQLIILGGYNYGTSKDNDFTLNLKNKSKGKNIVFTGYVDYEDIYSLYYLADLGIIPSIINEACPLTAIEMMASGIPVICTNSGGLPELINEKCGMIIDRNNLTNNLFFSIKKIFENKDKLLEYSKNAKIRSKKFAKEKYNELFWKYLNKFSKK